MTSFTAEAGRVRVEVDSALGSLISVKRQHPSGITVTVRGMDLAPLSGGQFIGWDYEMPVGVPVVYTASVYADATTLLATSAPGTVTWATTEDWLKDPFEPSRNTPVRLQQPASFDYATPSGVHTVIDRPDPIVVTSIRQAASGQVQFYTETQDERDRMHYITASGHTLLLQSTQVSGVGNMYLAPLSVSEAPVATRDDPSRIWTVGYQETGIPVGGAGGFNTWQDVALIYSTWQDLVTANPGNWLDFIAGFDSVPQAIVTWRGA